MIRIHLSASDLDAEFFPDDATQKMQCCMCAHHLVAKVPIDSAYDFGTDWGRQAVKGMPDDVAALVHRDDSPLFLLVIPGDGAAIGHLAAAAGIENGCVKRDFVAFDSDDCSRAFIRKAVYMVEQLRLHCLVLLFSKLKKKTSRPAEGREALPWYH